MTMLFVSKSFASILPVISIACLGALSACGSSSSANTATSTAETPTTTAGSGTSTTPPPPSSTSTSGGSATGTTGTVASGGTTKPPPATAPSPPTTPPPAAVAATAVTTVVTKTNNSDGCLPFTMPASTTLFNSTKKVFAHYVATFPVSIDNAAPANDYYNRQYLAKNGESNKWVKEGGFLRQRPLGVNPSTNSKWQQLNLEGEVRSAIARGITGFTFDIMAADQATNSNSPLNLMLAAATAVDARFKIVAMPDMTTLGTNSAAVIEIVEAVAKSPAAYRLSDGRLVISAFDASLNAAGWWASVLSQLAAKGIKTAFVPTFLNWTLSADAFASISYGFADWGGAITSVSSAMEVDPGIVHKTYDKIFMMPADPQQFRPKDYLFWEASNSAALRQAWMSSISGDADWVQLVTWNDFSESSQIQPYTDTTLNRSIGTGFYDLNGFYAAWFLTGQEPKATHDVLYYFYRRESTTAAGPAQSLVDHVATGTAENNVELLAFLTAPGTLKVTIGGKSYSQNASAGLTSFKVPTGTGTPVFSLSRSAKEVFSFSGGVQIYGGSGIPSGAQDLTYWSGSASKTGICSL
jgi:Glycosyl hydrolase family 71